MWKKPGTPILFPVVSIPVKIYSGIFLQAISPV
jgi:hypothetical protein